MGSSIRTGSCPSGTYEAHCHSFTGNLKLPWDPRPTGGGSLGLERVSALPSYVAYSSKGRALAYRAFACVT